MNTLNRRRYRRIPSAEYCDVSSDGRRATCKVLNESIGGFRVSGIHPTCLPRNQPLTIEYRDEIIEAFCTNVARDESAAFTIGLQRVDTMETRSIWDEPDSIDGKLPSELSSETPGQLPPIGEDRGAPKKQAPPVDGSLICPFVDVGLLVMVQCRILGVRNRTRLQIEILNKKQFEVDVRKVSPLMQSERKTQLEGDPHLDWLAEIYSKASGTHVDGTVESILEFEFGGGGSNVE